MYTISFDHLLWIYHFGINVTWCRVSNVTWFVSLLPHDVFHNCHVKWFYHCHMMWLATVTWCGLSLSHNKDCHYHVMGIVTVTWYSLSLPHGVIYHCHTMWLYHRHMMWFVTVTWCGLSLSHNKDYHCHVMRIITVTWCHTLWFITVTWSGLPSSYDQALLTIVDQTFITHISSLTKSLMSNLIKYSSLQKIKQL